LRIQFPGAFYHVLCRGNKRRNIFFDDDDRHWFLRVLRESLKIYRVKLYCYVLMDNHFHLLLQTSCGNLSEFMRRFNISYTSWFNYHHNTYGHLYQGRYKAILVNADNYLLELSRYVHLNPIRKSTFLELSYHDKWAYIRQYYWSSLPGYIDAKREVTFVDYENIIDMIGGRGSYRQFLLDGLQNDIDNPFEDVQYQTILGDSGFVARVKGEYLKSGSLREQPEYREIWTNKVDPDIVINCVMTVLNVSLD